MFYFFGVVRLENIVYVGVWDIENLCKEGILRYLFDLLDVIFICLCFSRNNFFVRLMLRLMFFFRCCIFVLLMLSICICSY